MNFFRETLIATIFLMPLFGVPMLLTANRSLVNIETCEAGDIYFYVTYSIEALQGILVSVLFCYFNSEVQRELKNTYRKISIRFREKFGVKTNSMNAKRLTTITNIVNNSHANTSGIDTSM